MINQPIIVIADLHGHLGLLERLIDQLDQDGILNGYQLLFLGDYFDRGPEVSQLIDYCLELQKRGHIFLAGNHEYVLEQVLNPDRPNWLNWLDRWARGYEDDTLKSYGLWRPKHLDEKQWIKVAQELKKAMPDTHYQFLASLPFIYETEDQIFVHAGLKMDEDWLIQKAYLEARDQSNPIGPPQIFSHQLAVSFDNPTPKQLVSGHAVVMKSIITPDRVLLNLGVDYGGFLGAWVVGSDEVVTVQDLNSDYLFHSSKI
jgi:serine/threonine protein phosphatase 1